MQINQPLGPSIKDVGSLEGGRGLPFDDMGRCDGGRGKKKYDIGKIGRSYFIFL